MRCDEAQQLISAGIDGELSRTNADELREHTQAGARSCRLGWNRACAWH